MYLGSIIESFLSNFALGEKKQLHDNQISQLKRINKLEY